MQKIFVFRMVIVITDGSLKKLITDGTCLFCIFMTKWIYFTHYLKKLNVRVELEYNEPSTMVSFVFF
jgi:hypothetical protein